MEVQLSVQAGRHCYYLLPCASESCPPSDDRMQEDSIVPVHLHPNLHLHLHPNLNLHDPSCAFRWPGIHSIQALLVGVCVVNGLRLEDCALILLHQ